MAPWLIKIHDQPGQNAAALGVKGVCAFDFVADTHAPQTKQASVVIDREPRMRRINGELWIHVVVSHMSHPQPYAEILQLAVAVRYAN
jgi:hypothetical protein